MYKYMYICIHNSIVNDFLEFTSHRCGPPERPPDGNDIRLGGGASTFQQSVHHLLSSMVDLPGQTFTMGVSINGGFYHSWFISWTSPSDSMDKCGKPMVLFNKMNINDLSSWWIFQIFNGIEWNSPGVSLADVENPWWNPWKMGG